MANIEFTPPQREFIVRHLAHFTPSQEIANLFVRRFPGVKCTEADVIALDPRFNIVAPELRTLFFAERERILSDPSLAPFASLSARLFALSGMAERAIGRNDVELARSIFRHIKTEQEEPAAGQGGAPSFGGGPVREVTRTVVDPVPVADE